MAQDLKRFYDAAIKEILHLKNRNRERAAEVLKKQTQGNKEPKDKNCQTIEKRTRSVIKIQDIEIYAHFEAIEDAALSTGNVHLNTPKGHKATR